MGMQYNAVPDSCCLRFSVGCGRNIFKNNQDRAVFPLIFTHGCITIIERRIKEHVVVRFSKKLQNTGTVLWACDHLLTTLLTKSKIIRSWAGSCTSELQLKVNWKYFLQKFSTIHFTCSESCALSKVNCSH